MKVSQEKSKFFENNVDYLGFTVSRGGIQTSQDKVQALQNFQIPWTLFALRSYLGLPNYYYYQGIRQTLNGRLKGRKLQNKC